MNRKIKCLVKAKVTGVLLIGMTYVVIVDGLELLIGKVKLQSFILMCTCGEVI